MKVIFLDVDGVLITAATCRKGHGIVDPTCVAAINELVAQTGAVIVLSSCWRIGRTRIEICDMLSTWGIQAQVLDKTPHDWNVKRGTEIQAWLDEHKERRDDVEAFVIIDDDSDMEHLLPKLVRTDFANGFTVAHIPAALELLKGTTA